MTLRQKQRISLAAMICGVILMILGNKTLGNVGVVLSVAGVVLSIAGFVFDVAAVRCPECKEWVGRNPGKFCRYCGAKIEWDKKGN